MPDPADDPAGQAPFPGQASSAGQAPSAGHAPSAPATAWASDGGRSRWSTRRRLAVVALVLLVLVPLGIFGLSQSDFGIGVGAAAAIYDRGKPEIVRANYSTSTNRAPIMQVLVAAGVDDVEASRLGCGLVTEELAQAGLEDVPWIIYGPNGQALASSSLTCHL